MATSPQTPMAGMREMGRRLPSDACLDGVGNLIQIHVAGDNLAVGAHHTDEGAVQLFRGVAQGKQASG